MRRKLLNLATAVSLALCLLAVVAWVLSYRGEPWAGYSRRTGGPGSWESRYVRLVSSKGAIWFADLQMLTPPGQPLSEGWAFRADGKETDGGRALGSVEGWLPSAPCSRGLGFVVCTKPFPVAAVPYWFVVACGAALPIAAACRRARRGARGRSGRCPTCGYDLRATPGRCPECGAESCEPPHTPPVRRTTTASRGAVE